MSSSELLFFWFLLVGLLKLLFDRMDMTTFEHQQLRISSPWTTCVSEVPPLSKSSCFLTDRCTLCGSRTPPRPVILVTCE